MMVFIVIVSIIIILSGFVGFIMTKNESGTNSG
jgi:hypothetical protein